MNRLIVRYVTGLAAVLLLAGYCLAQEITATPPGGIYNIGETIQWHIAIQGDDEHAVREAKFTLKKGGLNVIQEGTLDFTSGGADIETSLDKPGTILGEIKAKLKDKELTKLVGAAGPRRRRFAPPAAARRFRRLLGPAKIEELQAVPPNPVLEPADSGKPNIDYYKVKLDNIRGTHVYGELAKPKKEGKFPAMLIVPWAGVYELPKANVVYNAQQGWMALDIMAHDLPFDESKEYYDKISAKMGNYPAIGNEDRETSYFLRMFLGCYRAADYLAQRPDWDGRTLLVSGTSQGGLSNHRHRGHLSEGHGHDGQRAGQLRHHRTDGRPGPGWPYSARWAKDPHYQKIMDTARYFDAVNFASRVKCPALVALGLIDTTCPGLCFCRLQSVGRAEGSGGNGRFGPRRRQALAGDERGPAERLACGDA